MPIFTSPLGQTNILDKLWMQKFPDLVGGWTNPSEKNISQNGNVPQIGVKRNTNWNHHLVIWKKKHQRMMAVIRWSIFPFAAREKFWLDVLKVNKNMKVIIFFLSGWQSELAAKIWELVRLPEV